MLYFPRSSLGFKYRLQLNNTVGIIDSDYFFSDNEGHIFVKLTNDTKEDKTVELAEGAGFAQGIFLPFGITEDDDCTEARNGGFGSTDSRKKRYHGRLVRNKRSRRNYGKQTCKQKKENVPEEDITEEAAGQTP